MTVDPGDCLGVDRGMVEAPAGCGKTELLADCARIYSGSKPLLLLTHTQAGKDALRQRLAKKDVNPKSFLLKTIAGWAISITSCFPSRSGFRKNLTESSKLDYVAIYDATLLLIGSGHIGRALSATYGGVLVDEYQDCSTRQHQIFVALSKYLRLCAVGDPLQAVFGFDKRDPLPPWSEGVCRDFPVVGKLTVPHRWNNVGKSSLGDWLLSIREDLRLGRNIDLRAAPDDVEWVELTGNVAVDHRLRLEAGRTKPPGGVGSVLLIGDSKSPSSQQKFASQIPGATTVEAVDLRDLVAFSEECDFDRRDIVGLVARFASKLMTGVGLSTLEKRLEVLRGGKARKPANQVEQAALKLGQLRSCDSALDFLLELQRSPDTRVFRWDLFRACTDAMRTTIIEAAPMRESVVKVRDQYRMKGRRLPRRAVGSTLLLKGLEAEVAVILDSSAMSRQDLYVALTRGSKKLVVCSRHPVV